MNLADVISNQGNLEKSYKPFIIAEAGVNHEANMDLAIRLIEEAKEGGADAIKFQSYKAENYRFEKLTIILGFRKRTYNKPI